MRFKLIGNNTGCKRLSGHKCIGYKRPKTVYFPGPSRQIEPSYSPQTIEKIVPFWTIFASIHYHQIASKRLSGNKCIGCKRLKMAQSSDLFSP